MYYQTKGTTGLCIVKGVSEFSLARRRVCSLGLLLTIIMDFFLLTSKSSLVYDEKQFDKVYVTFSFKNRLNAFDFIFRSLSKAVGVLEMGGGSTQITFLPDGPLLAHMFTLRISGRIYNLYSHSYLNYGKDYMERRVKDYLIQQNPQVYDILNPCSLKSKSSHW